jgi:hypothetical protein
VSALRNLFSERRRVVAVLAGVGLLVVAAVVVIVATSGGTEVEKASEEANAGRDDAMPNGPQQQPSDAQERSEARNAADESQPQRPDEHARSGNSPSGNSEGDEASDSQAGREGIRRAIERAGEREGSAGASSDDEIFGAGDDGPSDKEAERFLEDLLEGEPE